MKDRTWTISNGLSFLRLLLALPIVILLLSERTDLRWWGVGMMFFAAATDIADGWLARLLHQESEFGRMLDPIADKIGIGATALVLVIRGDIPAWFVVLIIVRDATILMGGMYVKKRKGVVLPSNYVGKAAVLVLGLFLAYAAVPVATSNVIKEGFLAVGVIMLLISFLVYLRRFVQEISPERNR